MRLNIRIGRRNKFRPVSVVMAGLAIEYRQEMRPIGESLDEFPYNDSQLVLQCLVFATCEL